MILQYFHCTNSRLIITLQTKSRDIYCFCSQNCSFHRATISRLCFATNLFLCSEEKLIKITKKLWKNSRLDEWEKTFFYSFACAVFKDREKRWFLFLENDQECCNSRLLKSHMRLKKNRPYNHWLKSQGHYLLCFSTSDGLSQFGSLATLDYKPRYSLKATTKPPSFLEVRTPTCLGLKIPKTHERL